MPVQFKTGTPVGLEGGPLLLPWLRSGASAAFPAGTRRRLPPRSAAPAHHQHQPRVVHQTTHTLLSFQFSVFPPPRPPSQTCQLWPSVTCCWCKWSFGDQLRSYAGGLKLTSKVHLRLAPRLSEASAIDSYSTTQSTLDPCRGVLG